MVLHGLHLLCFCCFLCLNTPAFKLHLEVRLLLNLLTTRVTHSRRLTAGTSSPPVFQKRTPDDSCGFAALLEANVKVPRAASSSPQSSAAPSQSPSTARVTREPLTECEKFLSTVRRLPRERMLYRAYRPDFSIL